MQARFRRWLLHGSTMSQLAGIVGLALLLVATGIGLRDPWPADEPRYALVAKEMVDTGQWLFPHVAGLLYPDKPPLFFWLQAVLYSIFGSVRWTFLLPSLFASIGSLVLVYDLGRRLWRQHVGLVAALLLLACLQFVLQGRQGQIDATVSFWITLGMYGLLRHLLLGPQWGWYATACAAMAAGVITKGVGFLPLLLFIPWGFIRYRGWRLPQLDGGLVEWLAGPAAFVAVASAWLLPMLYVVMTSDAPDMVAYRNDILLKQTATRYADSWHHLEPAWYYLVNVIPVFWFPLSLLLPWLVPAWRRRIRRGDARYALLLGWVVLLLLFFSLSPGKRGVYILPALPMLALAAAPLLAGLLRKLSVRRMLFWTTFLFALTFPLAVVAYAILYPDAAVERIARYGVEAPWLLVLLLGGGGAAILLACRRRQVQGVALFITWMWLVYGLASWPLLDPVRSPASLMKDVRSLTEGATLGMAGWKEQMALHADRDFVHFGFRRDPSEERQDALRWLARNEDAVLLLSGTLPECIKAGQVRDLGWRHREHWWLAGHDDLDRSCIGRLSKELPSTLVVVDHLRPYR